MSKRLLWLFILSFFLNEVWEVLHSSLYIHYRGGDITQFILFRAAIADALMITVFTIPFFWIRWLRVRSWLLVVIGTAVAIGIEWYALSTGRWAYNEFMPIIPFLNTGLTPTIQLAMLGYAAYWIVMRVEKEKI